MRAYTSARVGPRQWKVLRAADDAYPGTITAREAGEAIRDSLTFSAHRPVLESLLDHGLLSHECDPGAGAISGPCLLRITERGELARMNKAAKRLAQL